MPAVTRKGDYNTSHGDFPAVPLSTDSSNVFINGISCKRKSDSYPSHSDEDSSHSSYISGGSSTVFVNGLPIVRVNDAVSCGGRVSQGSPNVYAN